MSRIRIRIKIAGMLAIGMAVAAVAAVNVKAALPGKGLSDLSLANVEALRSSEQLTGKCPSDNYECAFNCPSCDDRIVTAQGVNGKPTNLNGSCPKCGHSFVNYTP